MGSIGFRGIIILRPLLFKVYSLIRGVGFSGTLILGLPHLPSCHLWSPLNYSGASISTIRSPSGFPSV